MLEEKTTETRQDEPAAAQNRHTGSRARLRSLWAQLQCIHLLRRHRRYRRRKHRMDKVARKMRATPVILRIGALLYALGFGAEYAAVRTGRVLHRGALRIYHAFRGFFHDVAVTAFPGAAQVFKDLFGPILLFLKGCVSLVIHAEHIRREQGIGAAMKASVHYFADGVRRNFRLLPRMAMYVVPLCALALGVTVYEYVIQQPYALAVQVNGQTVGYVANEDVFDSAREAVQERLNYAGTDKTEWTIEPSYTIAVSHHMMDENEMADAIIKSAGDQIAEGTAIYLDGELTAVCNNGNALRVYLEDMLAPYENDDPDVSVGFNKSVTLEDGLYFTESLQDYQTVEQELVSVKQAQKYYTVRAGDTLWAIASKNGLTFRELCALNPDFKGAQLNEKSSILEGDQLVITKQEAALEVRITRIETAEEEIPYSTETTKSNEYEKGTTKVLQEGENGLRRVTMQNVYDTNNVLVEQTILSTETIKEPVNKKVVEGTKKKANSATKYITGSGQFIWPVPGYRYCSRWYGSGHKGVDICAAAGTPIYATASGTVTKAGYNKAGAGTGYGYSVIINHGKGYTSVYAHCLSLTVSAGQSVRQGQLIGYVGSTGRSTGNHCHFEIRLNGSYVPPQNVFPGKR